MRMTGNDIVEKVTALYAPPYRYLQDAHIDFPHANRRFFVEKTEYFAHQLDHVTDVEAQICLNQLCYATFAEAALTKKPEGFSSSLDEYFQKSDVMVIVESRKRFTRKIDPRVPFIGGLAVERFRKQGSLYLASVDFSLDNGAASGNLLVALKE